jgi:outer membrane autotransporter protein
VTGAATLGGTVQATFLPGGALARSTTILSAAGGRIGTFAALTTANLPASFTATLGYTATDVLLNLTLGLSGAFPAGLNDNQRAVAGVIDAAFNGGAVLSGGLATLVALPASQIPGALTALSGEIGTGVQTPGLAMGGQFFGAMLGQVQGWGSAGSSGGGAANAGYRVELAAARPLTELAQVLPAAGTWPPSVAPRIGAWASGFGLGGGRDGDAGTGSARLGYSIGGAAAGFDVALSPDLLLGLSAGGAGSGFALDGQPASGTARTIFFGAYGGWRRGPFYAAASAGYGHGQFSTTRTIVVGTTSELATGAFDGNQVGGRVEAGWGFAFDRWRVTPFAGVTTQALRQNAYAESVRDLATGLPGTLGLSYQAQTTTSVRSQLGVEAGTRFMLGERTTLAPRLRAAWAHEFVATRQVNASFLSLPAAAFTVSGARPARDAALVTAAVDLAFGRAVSLYAQFDGDLAAGGSAYAGSGGVRISW